MLQSSKPSNTDLARGLHRRLGAVRKQLLTPMQTDRNTNGLVQRPRGRRVRSQVAHHAYQYATRGERLSFVAQRSVKTDARLQRLVHGAGPCSSRNRPALTKL